MNVIVLIVFLLIWYFIALLIRLIRRVLIAVDVQGNGVYKTRVKVVRDHK